MHKISYIVPLCKFSEADYKDRLENIKFAISDFLGKQQEVEIEAILVEQSFNGQEYFFPISEQANIISKPSLTIIKKLVSHPQFNKGWLCNIGYNLSTSEHIFIADGDMFINNPSYFKNLLSYVQKNNLPWCIGWNTCYYLQRTAKSNLFHGNNYAKGNCVRVRRGGSEGGIVYFKKDFYKAIGGMNEWMVGLGGMDNCIAMRAHWLSNKYAPFNHNIGHLYHSFSPMKNDNSRKNNSRIFKYVCTRPRQAIGFMRGQAIGDLSGPLCNKTTFMGKDGIPNFRAMNINASIAKKEITEKMEVKTKVKIDSSNAKLNIFDIKRNLLKMK